MKFEQAIDWLYGTQLFGIKLGLENVLRLLEDWDLPDPDQRIVHVAGTNGKGSVCAMIDSICRAQGYRTGLFTSPHLVTYRERIRVNGEMIPEAVVARLLSELRERVENWEPHPTFFELTMALALKHFAEREAQIAVLETGMGGRLDATNAVRPAVAVITAIAMDHEKWLGDSLEMIAAEKAGIIKAGVPVVSAPQKPAAWEVLRDRTERWGAPLTRVDADWQKSNVGLAGEHQRRNAALAVRALEAAEIAVGEAAIRAGLEKVSWRSRFERLPPAAAGGPEIILDGAHNPDAANALSETWREVFGEAKAAIVFGAVKTKDVHGMLEYLAPLAERFIFTEVNSPRTVTLERLFEKAAGLAIQAEPAAGAADALEQARKSGNQRVLVTGSLFLTGEVLALIEAGAFEVSLQ